MRELAAACAALAWLSACAPGARAADYYVATTGADSNPGTRAAPFRTVQKGADSASSPGDSVFLREGVYESREPVFLRHSGLPGRPITLARMPGESPVVRFLDAESGRHPRLEIQNPERGASAIGWLVVEGLEISGGYEGIKYYNAHDLVIRGNRILDSSRQGILGVGGVRVVISSNTIRGSGDPGIDPKNRTLINKLHGLYASGTRYEISGNVFDASLAWGIQAAGYAYDEAAHAGPEYAGASGWRIADNLFARGRSHGGIVMWLPGARDNVIERNVFYDNARQGRPGEAHGITFQHSGPGNAVVDNVFFSKAAGANAITDTWAGASYTESGSRFLDPGIPGGLDGR